MIMALRSKKAKQRKRNFFYDFFFARFKKLDAFYLVSSESQKMYRITGSPPAFPSMALFIYYILIYPKVLVFLYFLRAMTNGLWNFYFILMGKMWWVA